MLGRHGCLTVEMDATTIIIISPLAKPQLHYSLGVRVGELVKVLPSHLH